ncbi:hypothetical protein ACH5RR_008644 [Cinchona calisaya]|uniref:Uncharacterized protein n=1 Tax=Cinchona calisaya TaxID=153742 RepID=A0ABD3AFS1_9GENT
MLVTLMLVPGVVEKQLNSLAASSSHNEPSNKSHNNVAKGKNVMVESPNPDQMPDKGKVFRDLFESTSGVGNFEKIQQCEVEVKLVQRKNILYKEVDNKVSFIQGVV